VSGTRTATARLPPAAREALLAARAGRTGEAQRLADLALAQGADPAAFNTLLGLFWCRTGNLGDGIGRLRLAHEACPGDHATAANLVAALLEQGLLEDAYEIAGRERSLSAPNLRLARLRAYLAQSLGHFAAAVEAYEHVVAKDPCDFDSWNNLGNARLSAGDLEGSVAALVRALELDRAAPPVRLNLAAALAACGRFDEAERVLRGAAADFPDDVRPVRELYLLLKRQGRSADALLVLEEAAARDTADPDLQLKLAVEYGLVRRVREAEGAFRKTIAMNPALADAYVGLAVHLEHSNQAAALAPLADLARSNAAGDDTVAFIRALDSRRSGQFAKGLEWLSHVSDGFERQRVAHLRATLLDRLGETAEAFCAFRTANRLHESDPTDPLGRAAAYRDQLAAEIDLLTPEWARSWRGPETRVTDPGPVFIVGFPRSGTTLLDTMLMGHPGTRVMEEEPPMNLVEAAIGGMSELPRLDGRAIADARLRYYDEAANICGELGDRLLIDKSPLFLAKVPLIHRLFPNARFILVLRHPCDCVLSCFMSNFRLNDAMSNFLRLEDAARLYDLAFTHWRRSIALMPVRVRTIAYERLIADPETELRRLLAWLGLGWRDGVIDHRRTASLRGFIKTASYSQVTEPLYSRSAGRWLHYREEMRPVLPVLAPWAQHWGYVEPGIVPAASPGDE
jgi:tetratricopeptide (TPR) repeat protein